MRLTHFLGIEEQLRDNNLSVQTISVGTANIVSAVEEIDAFSRVISGHTQTTSAAAEERSASSQEISSASQGLTSLSGELQETTRPFKV